MTDTILAQLSGVKASVDTLLKIDRPRINANLCGPLIKNAKTLFHELKTIYPDLYKHVEFEIDAIAPRVSNDYGNTFTKEDIIYLQSLLEMAVQTWTSQNNSIIQTDKNKPRRVFISHGHNPDWMSVQRYLESELGIDTLELQQQENKGRTVIQKLYEESQRCGYAVIVMTGDDSSGEDTRARQNVVHEIGYFQGLYGFNRVCILYQEGVEIFSNIYGLVYIPYPKDHIDATFHKLSKELRTIL